MRLQVVNIYTTKRYSVRLKFGTRISLYDLHQLYPILKYRLLAMVTYKNIKNAEYVRLIVPSVVSYHIVNTKYVIGKQLWIQSKLIDYAENPKTETVLKYMKYTGFHDLYELLHAYCQTATDTHSPFWRSCRNERYYNILRRDFKDLYLYIFSITSAFLDDIHHPYTNIMYTLLDELTI